MNFSFSPPLRRSASRRSPAAPSNLSQSLRFAWVLLVAAFLPVASAGTITGTVSATQGNVPGATISLSRTSIGLVGELPSDNSADYSGYYTYLDIPSTSGSSEEIIRIAIPRPASSERSLCTSALVPTSIPAVRATSKV